MADIMNCRRCGRMFQSVNNQKICARCRDTDEEDFKIVREYVYDNPNTNVNETAEETGVAKDKILKFLRQGKLVLKSEEGIGLDCERCGKAIDSGRYCDECKFAMTKELQGAASTTATSAKASETKKTGSGMHSRKK